MLVQCLGVDSKALSLLSALRGILTESKITGVMLAHGLSPPGLSRTFAIHDGVPLGKSPFCDSVHSCAVGVVFICWRRVIMSIGHG